jgi:hypothetical protein
MEHNQLRSQLAAEGFYRVERDDRLLDVFPTETREKGIELWEKWLEDTVELVRICEPFTPPTSARFTIPRATVEKALRENRVLRLDTVSRPGALSE